MRGGGLRLVGQDQLQTVVEEVGFRFVASMAPESWSYVVVCEVALLWDAMRGAQESRGEKRENACSVRALYAA